jgi:hypothetical protein
LKRIVWKVVFVKKKKKQRERGERKGGECGQRLVFGLVLFSLKHKTTSSSTTTTTYHGEENAVFDARRGRCFIRSRSCR